jgi:ADP-ribose pyrophosphatase
MSMEEKKYSYTYPHPAVTTDCVLIGTKPNDKNTYVLLVQRGREPFKDYWAFPGGFLNIDEQSEQGAARELKEETNIAIEPQKLLQLHTFTAVNRDPRERVISIVFYASVNMQELCPPQGGDDAAKAQWFNINNVPPLAFDHKEILLYALKRIVSDFDSELCVI